MGTAVIKRTTGYVPALDGIRAFAVIAVMLFHFWREGPRDPVHAAVSHVFTAGWAGVDLFFVLSGFLITGILLDARGRPRYFRTFYTRRALRIFPLFYIALLFRFWLLPALFPDSAGLAFTPSQARWAVSYLNNVASVLPGQVAIGISHFWSLAIEEQFYLVWPAVVLISGTRRLKGVIAGIVVVAFFARIAAVLLWPERSAAYYLTPMRADALAMGAWLAIMQRSEGGLKALRRPALVALGVSAATILAVALAAGRFHMDEPAVGMFGIPAVDVGAAALIVVVLTSAPRNMLRRVCESRPAGTVGRYSYCLYVVHWPLCLAIRDHWPMETLPTVLGSRLPAQLIFDAVLLALSFTVAAISWRVLEQPILKLKERSSYTAAAEPA